MLSLIKAQTYCQENSINSFLYDSLVGMSLHELSHASASPVWVLRDARDQGAAP